MSFVARGIIEQAISTFEDTTSRAYARAIDLGGLSDLHWAWSAKALAPFILNHHGVQERQDFFIMSLIFAHFSGFSQHSSAHPARRKLISGDAEKLLRLSTCYVLESLDITI
jgi:hypothetical protein